jgi:broad specificity phosphatase PhoE
MILLVRHEETDWEMTRERGLVGLQQDFVQLTRAGERRAEKLGESPQFFNAELIVSSPYTRALQTAALINRTLDLPLIIEFDLHELLPDTSRRAHEVEKTLQLCADFDANRGAYPPGQDRPWESLESAGHRVKKVLKKYSGHNKVIVVCHEKVIKSLIGWRPIGHGEIIEYPVPGEPKN